jgi:hypothetical protein
MPHCKPGDGKELLAQGIAGGGFGHRARERLSTTSPHPRAYSTAWVVPDAHTSSLISGLTSSEVITVFRDCPVVLKRKGIVIKAARKGDILREIRS